MQNRTKQCCKSCVTHQVLLASTCVGMWGVELLHTASIFLIIKTNQCTFSHDCLPVFPSPRKLSILNFIILICFLICEILQVNGLRAELIGKIIRVITYSQTTGNWLTKTDTRKNTAEGIEQMVWLAPAIMAFLVMFLCLVNNIFSLTTASEVLLSVINFKYVIQIPRSVDWR